MPKLRQCCVISCAVLLASVSVNSQEPRREELGQLRVGPFSRTAVRDAPFSAIASTVMVLKANRDGMRVRLTTTSRVYRDSNGRVRVDYDVPAAARGQTRAGTPMQKMAMLMTDDGPDPDGGLDPDGRPHVYSLDPARRTFRIFDRGLAAAIFNAETQFGIPTGVTAHGAPHFSMFLTADVHATNGVTSESLGRARIEGVEAIGWRMSGVWPIVCKGCEGPGMQTDERWESPDLQVVVLARHLDRGEAVPIAYPGQGIDIEYRLTKIVRDEPPAELFNVPANYVRHWGGPSDPDVSMGP